MNPTNPTNAATLMLMMSYILALAVACIIFVVILIVQRRRAKELQSSSPPSPSVLFDAVPQRPVTWLAIRAAAPEAVMQALGLDRSTPCSWSEGMAGDHEFFISSRINGWVIVTGIAIPSPDDDIDECFYFLISLSRKLGHVQFFHAEKFSFHHAWMRMDDGCVTRAYAWAGETIWNQGIKTAGEMELKMKCFPYGQDSFSAKAIEDNFNKVSMLATRWSLDPARIRSFKKSDGIAGQSQVN
ncbi:MAG TPA: hypothetical protein VGI03_12425 [Verrucomicrobiae bacterium]